MNLWDTPAGFDEPLAALSACHRRIEKQMSTLTRLHAHIARNGFDDEARVAAAAILRYFISAVPHHHADEEVDLFPKLLRTAEALSDRARAFELVSHLLIDHREMEAAWVLVREALEGLQSGEKSSIDSQLCDEFVRIYSSHIEREDHQLFPLAARLFSKADLETLGIAMARRRGLPPPVFDQAKP